MRFTFRKHIKRMMRIIDRHIKTLGTKIGLLIEKWKALPFEMRIITLGGPIAVIAVVAVAIIIIGAKENETMDIPDSIMIGDIESGGKSSTEMPNIEVTPEPTPEPTPTPVPTPTPTQDPTLKRGMECEEVMDLQNRLMRLGYLDLDESTYKFGPATEDAVRRFQRQVNFNETLGINLSEDGIAGLNTLDLLYSDDAPKYCLIYGMEGDDITDMQEQLVDLGYLSSATGNYLEKTVEALKSFQSENDLSADGMCGAQTIEMLYSDSAVASPSKRKEARTKANINKMIETAKAQLGKKYVLGNRGPNSFDCSGLVYYCLKQAGSNRNRLNAAGYSAVSDWEKIKKMSNLKKGDIICFYSDDFSKIGHVGIVINNSGEMIDASSRNGKVVRRDYETTYWKKHFYCGRRPW